jgi:class 3 adenylate cyclase
MVILPTGTVTFLLADIEGSTARGERDPAAMHEALARPAALLAAGIEQHGGAVVKSRGEADSVFAVFGSGLDRLDPEENRGGEPRRSTAGWRPRSPGAARSSPPSHRDRLPRAVAAMAPRPPLQPRDCPAR